MTTLQTISQLANQCVLCGICIPHCPTYHIFKSENESPRGRIALFKALAENEITTSQALLSSLDHCLGCRACERICPSQVNYAQLSHLGRALIASELQSLKQPLSKKLVETLLPSPQLQPWLKLASKSLQPFVISNHKKTKGNSQKNSNKVTSKNKQKNVLLFHDCTSELFEYGIIDDIKQLINACGINIISPKKHSCCGAISLRKGDMNRARTQINDNIKQLVNLDDKDLSIVAINNVCSAQLSDYQQFSDIPNAEKFADKIMDAIHFLVVLLKEHPLQFSPMQESIGVGVHISCSLKNALKEELLLFELLENIPNIKLDKINDRFCCGAAGSYRLQYPEIANQLLDIKLDDIKAKQHKLIVSSNFGCSMHFNKGLQQQNIQKVEVLHPISLLARQLIF